MTIIVVNALLLLGLVLLLLLLGRSPVLSHRGVDGLDIGKGTNGVGANGVTARFRFFDRGTSGVLPLTYFLGAH